MAGKKQDGRGKSPGSAKTQFPSGGPSANPLGRPKGSVNRAQMIARILGETVPAELGGRKRKISITEASIRRLAQLALKGDRNAIRDVLQLWKESEEAMTAASEATYPFADTDRAVIAEIYARMKACQEPQKS